MGSLYSTKETFLWWIGLIYFCAFSSLYFQIPGLYGEQGILPVNLFLKAPSNAVSFSKLIESKPTLLWIAPVFGCSMSEMMEVLSLCGMFISLLVISFRKAVNMVNYFALWIMYFSLYQVGQTFLHFQWDILLLEAGFLAIVIAPLCFPLIKFNFYAPHDEVTLWLVKWLFFRLMFASGVVKLTSRCPTWWQLTALHYHFESQCLPTPLSWIFHHFPDWFLKLSVILTLIIEIIIPILFFAPIRSMRIFSYWCQFLLQVLIITTGNYNFFNILTLTLGISLLDDKFLWGKDCKSSKLETSNRRSMTKTLSKFFKKSFVLGSICGIIYLAIELFEIRIRKDGHFSAKLNFTPDQFELTLSKAIPITIWLAVISLTAHIFHSIYVSLRVQGLISKFRSIFGTIVMSFVAVFIFSISVVPHSVVDKSAYSSIWPVVRQWQDNVQKYEIVNSYGLFRRMTGVGGRPEIVIEGSNSIDSGWKEYEFFYKPGNLSTPPTFVAPHQPRLDWQMWFAALGSYHHNPWFINFINCLLNNRKDVLKLIHHNPFPDQPPKYIRAILYKYKYTPYSSELRKNNNWWRRSDGTEYLPVLTKDNPSLQDYLREAGFYMNEKDRTPLNNMTVILEILRGILGSMTAPVFIWTVCIIAIISRRIS